jgi:branched-chain amino acid transport system permease protein
MISFIQLFVTGISVGLIYGLVALGFVLIYKGSKIFNFAQGEMVMVGSFLTWTFVGLLEWPFYLGLFLSFLVAGVVGYFLERFPFRPMIGQPILATIMVTLGIAVFLRGMTVLFWSKYIGIQFPRFIPEKTHYVFQIPFSNVMIWNFILVLSLVIIFSLFFNYTRTGLHMRAAAENQQLAQSMGIRVTKVIALSWAIAAVVSTVAGFLFGYTRGIDVGLANLGLIAVAAALVGGLESFKGAIIGGLIIGVAETLTGYYIGHGLKEVVPFIVMVAVVYYKPYGLFGLEKIERV